MRNLILFVSAIALVACQSDFDNSIEEKSQFSDDSFKITEADAVRRLERMLDMFEPTTRGERKTIKEIIPRLSPKTRTTSEMPDTLMYIINFDDEDGYAVVSADERVSDFLLALIDTGSYTPTRSSDSHLDSLSYEELYDLLDEDEKDDFWCTQKELFDCGNSTENLLPIYIIEDHVTSEINKPVEYKKTMIDTVLMNQVGPFLCTKWGQDKPYNYMCHSCPDGEFHYDPNAVNCKTGCIATALAQILAYHKYPSSAYGHTSDWDLVHQKGHFYTYSSYDKLYEVSRLMKSAGIACQMNYGVDASSSTANRARRALQNIFGYSGAERSLGFHATRIVNKLNSGAMALVSGKKQGRFRGHAWVIDGYRKYKFTTTTVMYTDDTYTEIKSSEVVDEEEKYYYHCNFGWEGTADGYYLGKIFNVYQGPEFVEDDIEPYSTSSDKSKNYTWIFRTVTYDNPNQ